MDRNTILAFALIIAVYSLWLGYQTSLEPPPQEAAQTDASRQAADSAQVADSVENDARVNNTRQDPLPRQAEPISPGLRADETAQVAPWSRRIQGKRFAAGLTNRGAALTEWTLVDFYELDATGRKGEPIALLTLDDRTPRALEMAFDELGFGDLSSASYEVESESADRFVFRLERGGVEVRKIYEFDLEGYGFGLEVEVRNNTDRLIAPSFAVRWPSAVRKGNDYTEESLVALHREEMEREQLASVGGAGFLGGLFGGGGEEEIWRDIAWVGVDLKFFTALLLPDPAEGTRATFEPLEAGQSAQAVLEFAASEIAPGQSLSRHLTAFMGPKEPVLLESVGREVGKTVDLGYSWFEPLTRFFQWLLHSCYKFVPNYGWSIIIITILVRLLTMPIMNRQMRSMEKMRGLQPRMKEIQAEFADDRQKQSEATMALYKETGVNPLGGCFPMLLQFPVFIGLFFALRSSFDLRQAPFALWINDLSAPEALFVIPGLDIPLRVLPIIMGGSMILQQKLTPTTVDPSQQMMMMVMMPVMMTVLFYQFPSGLVLYWMVSNFLGIAHQMLVGRRMKAAEA